jgi:hypothetical protein
VVCGFFAVSALAAALSQRPWYLTAAVTNVAAAVGLGLIAFGFWRSGDERQHRVGQAMLTVVGLLILVVAFVWPVALRAVLRSVP